LLTKNYFVIGIICLIAGSIFLIWGIDAYVTLKQAEINYRELPQKSPPGSSAPYPGDDFFWQRNGILVAFFIVGSFFLIKWKKMKNYPCE
jgi:hypothetical protein